MKKRKIALGVFFALLVISGLPAFAKEPRHLLVAKFTLKRLESVGLTVQQRASFNELSGQLRSEIDALRASAGITKEVMSRRDETHQALKVLKLSEGEYWKRLQSEASLNDAQASAFKLTAEKYKDFKSAALALLTEPQKAKLPKKRNQAK